MSTSLFAFFPDETAEELRRILRTEEYRPGEVIFHQGEKVHAVYVVLQGRVKIVRLGLDGEESILCIRQAGDYFCPVSLLDGRSHLGTAIAMTRTILLWAERQSFLELCRENPQLLTLIQTDCLDAVRSLLHRLELVVHHTLRERVVATLLGMAGDLPNGKPAELSLTHEELAEVIGASRESVSRVLKVLEREGFLELRRGKIRLHDLQRLKNQVAVCLEVVDDHLAL